MEYITEEFLLKNGFIKLWHLNTYSYVLRVDESISFTYSLTNGLSVSFTQQNHDENIDLGEFNVIRYLPFITLQKDFLNLYLLLTDEHL